MKYLFTLFFYVYSALVYSETFPANYLTPSNIQWSKQELPKDIVTNNTYVDWGKSFSIDRPNVRWSYVSILSKDSQEILIQELIGGSGGVNTLILQKSGNQWKKLVNIFGGFIFYPVPDKKHTLVIFERSGGDYFRTELHYNGNSYVKKSSYEVPIELTRLNGSPIDFYKYF